MQIVDKKVINTPYAILTITKSNRVCCEYFSDYPDAKLSTLFGMDLAELKKQNIAGYAVCSFSSPIWEVDKISGLDSRARQILMDYVRNSMNNGYVRN